MAPALSRPALATLNAPSVRRAQLHQPRETSACTCGLLAYLYQVYEACAIVRHHYLRYNNTPLSAVRRCAIGYYMDAQGTECVQCPLVPAPKTTFRIGAQNVDEYVNNNKREAVNSTSRSDQYCLSASVWYVCINTRLICDRCFCPLAFYEDLKGDCIKCPVGTICEQPGITLQVRWHRLNVSCDPYCG